MAVDRLVPTTPPSNTTFAYAQGQLQEELTALWQGAVLPLTVTNALPNAVTATCSPTLAAYTDTLHFTVTAAATNTGAMTLSIDGLGARPVVTSTNSNLTAGQVVTGQMLQVTYDTAISAFRVMGGLAVSSGTTLPNPTQQWQVLQADSTLTPAWNSELFSGNF